MLNKSIQHDTQHFIKVILLLLKVEKIRSKFLYVPISNPSTPTPGTNLPPAFCLREGFSNIVPKKKHSEEHWRRTKRLNGRLLCIAREPAKIISSILLYNVKVIEIYKNNVIFTTANKSLMRTLKNSTGPGLYTDFVREKKNCC